MRVDYNLDAVARIRKGASAPELGWDVPFYLNVCRKHGLEPVALHPKTHTMAEIAKDATPPLAPPISCTEAKRIAKTKPAPVVPIDDDEAPPEFKGWILNLSTRRLRIGGAMVTIAKQQLEVLRYINKGSPTDPINGRWIAERLGINPVDGNVGGAVSALRLKLFPLGLKIIAVKGRQNAGYWLADAKTDTPVKLCIVGVRS